MFPTLHDGDAIVVSHLAYTPKQGDIVVIIRDTQKKEPIIKRIIALEDQTVDINFTTGNVYVDNKLLEEPYINEPTTAEYDVTFPVTVPKGCIFVLGDNRNVSLDSRDRSVGMVNINNIMGKAYVRILPMNSIGLVK